MNVKIVTAGWLFFSLLGFLDATYLTVRHYHGAPPPCSVSQGCEAVTTSQYAVLQGIPIALLGSVFYLSVFLLVVAYLDSKQRVFLEIIHYSTTLGFLVSLILVCLQIFVIQSICLYCMISALTCTALYILNVCRRVKELSRPPHPAQNKSNVIPSYPKMALE